MPKFSIEVVDRKDGWEALPPATSCAPDITAATSCAPNITAATSCAPGITAATSCAPA